MHDYTMKTIGCYIKEHYNPETMTCCELDELEELSEIFVNLLKGDYYYNVVKSMEEGHGEDSPMDMEEFIARAEDMYALASPTEKQIIKTKLVKIIT